MQNSTNRKRLLKIIKTGGIYLLVIIILIVSVIVIARIIHFIQSKIDTSKGIQESGFVNIGGIDQFIQIRGRDKNNPLILFVHGGPGNPLTYLTYYYQQFMETEYTIVQWEQRGCGRTYYQNLNCMQDDLTPTLVLNDMDELVNYLLGRFGQKSLIVLGHSWGTVLGSRYVQAHPEKVTAYLAVSQAVNILEGTLLAAETANNKAIEKGSKKDSEKLISLIQALRSTSGFDDANFKDYLAIRSLASKYMPYSGARSAFEILWPGVASPDFSVTDLRWFIQSAFSTKTFIQTTGPLLRECFYFDVNTQSKTYKVPVYFISGEYDWTTPQALVEEYYHSIYAPDKDFILIENTGHSPYLDAPEEFSKTVIQLLGRLKKGSYPLTSGRGEELCSTPTEH